MASIRSVSVLAALALSLGLVACGSGDDDDGGGGGTVDAPSGNVDAPGGSVDASIDAPAGVNALGQVCSMSMACPAGNSCTTLQGIGSQTMGYCSPMCNGMDTLCSTGYTGPAGGMPRCVLTTMQGAPATGCAIICTADNQCPTGLTCQQVPNNQVKICAVPA